jgi:AhpD family alkylhydroperoxidase
MPRIAPVPWEYLSDEQRREIDASRAINASGKVSMTSQVLAYSSVAFRAMKQHARILFRTGVIEPRLQELLRIRSADLNGCAACSAARKEAVSEEDVACLVNPALQGLSQRERAALAFLEQMAGDHFAINGETFKELAKTFTTAEIVELGWRCAQLIGAHRFIHCLDMLGTEEPVIGFDPTQIDRSNAPPEHRDTAA